MVAQGCLRSGFDVYSDGDSTATPDNLYQCSITLIITFFFLCAFLMCFLITCHSAGMETWMIWTPSHLP